MPSQRSAGGSRTLEWFPDQRGRRLGIDYCGRSITRATVGREAWAGLERHVHDTWEITWLRSGSLAWWSDGTIYDLEPGWCHVTAPGTPHGSCSGLLEPSEFCWIQIDPRRIGGVSPAAAAALAQGLARLPPTFWIGNLHDQWRELLDALRAMPATATGPLSDLDAQACLHRLLLRLLDRPARRRLSPRLARAQRRADEGRADVAALSRAAGCSPATLHRLFHDEIGETPAAWMQQRRIQVAKRRLRGTVQSVTQIALDLGFRSSQHFATSFRRATGLTPTRYRDFTLVHA